MALGDAEPGVSRKGFRADRPDRIRRSEPEAGHWDQMTESEGLGKGFRVAVGAQVISRETGRSTQAKHYMFQIHLVRSQSFAFADGGEVATAPGIHICMKISAVP